jgi:hypothetical protein
MARYSILWQFCLDNLLWFRHILDSKKQAPIGQYQCNYMNLYSWSSWQLPLFD